MMDSKMMGMKGMKGMKMKDGCGSKCQPALKNKTMTGKAGMAVGLTKGTDGPIVRMGGMKR